MGLRKFAAWAAVVLGVVFVISGVVTAVIVSNQLSDEKIVTADDACLPGRDVKGPFTAYCQAKVIQKHALEATGGQTYAELPRDSELRDVAMQASFLRASLYTSVVAFGVAAMAVATGLLFILIGLGMRDVRRHLDEAQAPTVDLTADDAEKKPTTVSAQPIP